MVIDTTEKKLSLLNFGLPLFRTLPEADGTITQGDRQHLLGLYAGILASEGAGPPYRVAEGEVFATGRTAGQIRTDGRATGQVFADGAIAGEVDGRSG